MKKRYIGKNTKGISAVIGVVLMVAIVAAVSSIVFLYIYQMTEKTYEETPIIQIRVDDDNDRLIIHTTNQAIQWNEIGIRSMEPITILINGEVKLTTSNNLLADDLVIIDNDNFLDNGITTNNLNASDYIDIESINDNEITDVKISLTHLTSNRLIGTYHFEDIIALDD
jgi:hypothetical protein